MSAICLLTICLLGQANSAEPAALPPAARGSVDYLRDVRPVLEKRCAGCHGPETQESGFRVDRREALLRGGDLGEPAVVPGKSGQSLLVKAVAGVLEDLSMPPEGPRLTPSEIGLLRAWIDQGLHGPDGAGQDLADTRPPEKPWSFQPPAEVRVPAGNDPWIETPVDAFILAQLKQNHLEPSPAASRRVLIRRLSLDLLGLLPAPEQVAQFVADPRADAYARLVDRVLASPHYGERWARHWLDVVRFAETNGFETNTPRPNAYPYRDYVIAALNSDKPYDRFVFEQLAGDAVGQDVATGFLVGGPYDTVKSPDVSLTLMQRQDELADMINTTGTALLGLTLGCARCHNHKFDPVLQRDYYSLQAVLAGVGHGERPLDSVEQQQRATQIGELEQRLADIDLQLSRYSASEDASTARRTLLIDDEAGIGLQQFTRLAEKRGHGTNPPGSERGLRDDVGDIGRMPNIGGGSYTWWQSEPHQDLAAYQPGVAGQFRIWLSWGCGFATHATDAEYWLDDDGDLQTQNDQTRLAVVDQQRFADGSGDVPGKPLWSGLYDAGVHSLSPASRIVLRGGAKSAAVTADAIVLDELLPTDAASAGASSLPRLRPAVDAAQNVEAFPPVRARYVRFTVLATNSSEPCIDELEVFTRAEAGERSKNVALAAGGAKVKSSGDFPGNPKHKLQHIHDGLYGNSHSWISNEVGKGWVEIDLGQPQWIERIVWGRDRERQYADRLPTQYRIDAALEPGRWVTVAGSVCRRPVNLAGKFIAAFQLAALPKAEQQTAARLVQQREQLVERLARMRRPPSMVYAGVFTQPPPTYRLHRGDPLERREQMAPDTLSVFGTLGLAVDESEQRRRVALARWIIGGDNPLTPRVAVNRLWHYHFGAGLVATPSDFGAAGAGASHPQLLDWLARELIRSGWSLKHMHRLIVMSSTYRQSNAPDERRLAVDQQSRLLWRFPPRRMEAEAIRDNVLLVSGSLDSTMYGPGFSVFEPNENYVRVYLPKQQWSRAEWRRMIYMFKVRMEQDPVFGTFDCPDAGQPAPKRGQSTTAIQALNLLNSSFMVQQADRFAERVEREAGTAPDDQLRRVFQLALGRDPVGGERDAGCRLIAEHGLTALCRAVLNANEFLWLP